MASQGDGCLSLAGKPGGPAPEFIMQVRRMGAGGPPHTLDHVAKCPRPLSDCDLRPVDCCILLLCHNHFNTGKC